MPLMSASDDPDCAVSDTQISNYKSIAAFLSGEEGLSGCQTQADTSALRLSTMSGYDTVHKTIV